MGEPRRSATGLLARRGLGWRWAVSLRGLMVLVLIIGGGLGWGVQQARARRDALAVVAAGGGQIVFRDSDPQELGWWAWFYRRTGFEFAREVQCVSLDDGSKPPVPASGPVARAAVFPAIGRLGRIDWVSVTGGQVTPADLTILAPVQVSTLFLNDVAEVSPAALAAIARLGSLTRLRIQGTRVKLSPAVVPAVAGLTRLEELHLHGLAPLKVADLAPLGRLARLRSLVIHPAPRDEAVLDLLGGMHAMTGLNLIETQVTDGSLRRLVAAMPRLENLAFDGTKLTDAGVEALATLPNLKGLAITSRWRTGSVPSGRLTDASLQALGKCRALSALMFNGGRFTDAGLDALQGLPLRTLILGSIESARPASLARLVTGPTWKLLGLHGPGITDAALPILAAVVRPQTCLDLQGSAVTDAGMAQLATFPNSRLWLTGTALTDAGLARLTAAPSLREVVAWDTRVTPAGAAAFRATRPATDLVFGPEPADD